MRKFSTAILLLIIVILTGCQAKQVDNEAYNYKDEVFMVKLAYPKEWSPNNLYDPPRYEGETGFFQISAVSGIGLNIDQLAKLEVEHKLLPYGAEPVVEDLLIAGQEARLILPSEDQNTEMDNQAGLLIKYPTQVVIKGEGYDYFVLWADKEHIRSIGETIKFTK